MAKKSDMAQIMRETGLESRPDSTKKRIAPNKRQRRSKYHSQEERDEAHGVNASYRIKPATKAAVNKAAGQHNVKIGQLADFMLRGMLELIAQGRVNLPLLGDEPEGFYEIELPDIPDVYL